MVNKFDLKMPRLTRADRQNLGALGRAGPVVFSVPSAFYRNWIANNYEELIAATLAAAMGCEIEIQYQVEADFS